MFLLENKYLRNPRAKIVPVKCSKCNNKDSFYRYGKNKNGYQKYLCRKCNHQFAPNRPLSKEMPKYPCYPVCGRVTFLHHDYEYYSIYRCCDKKYNHFMFVPKPNNILPVSMSKLVGKNDFKRMRYPVHIIITVLFMFYIGKNSFRNIVLIFRVVHNVKVSHTTIGSHLSPYRNSQQAFALLNPVKSVLGEGTKHIRVESFKDDISNNLIESFHHLYVLEIIKANFKVI